MLSRSISAIAAFRLAEFFFGSLGALDSRIHAIGDIFSGDQNVDFEVGRLHFLFRRGCIEAIPDVIMLRAGIFLQLAEGDVMVGEQQAVRADEGARAAVIEPHGGKPQMVQPLLGGREIVLLLELLDGRVVEGPHAFVSGDGGAE